MYQQILLAENISFEYKTIARLQKKDQKVVKIDKKIMTNLIGHI